MVLSLWLFHRPRRPNEMVVYTRDQRIGPHRTEGIIGTCVIMSL